jgi:hypothetical protein
MFYIWHTLIIATFIAVAYWLGYNHGVKQEEKHGRKKAKN